MNAPPAAQPPPPVISPPTNKSYRSKRNEELEALRRKGLATIFNKHFTSVADKIRQERKAAELALAEIVKRKAELAANPKSFEGGLTITQLDKLHMELKRRKNEVQMKERETVELWRRYCSQYGDNNETTMTQWKDTSGDNYEGTMNDDMSIVRQSDLKSKDIVQISGDIKEITEQYEDGTAFGVKENHAKIVTPTNVWKRPEGFTASELRSSVSNTQKMSVPEKKKYAVPDAIAPLTSITPVKSVVTFSPATNNISYTPMKDNIGGMVTMNNGVTVDSSPNIATALSTPPPMSNKKADHREGGNDDWCNGSVMDRSLYLNSSGDDESCISGITEIDCATVAEAEWKLTEFLRTERENIKKMFRDEPTIEECTSQGEEYSAGLYSKSERSALSSARLAKATQAAEALVKQMEEDTKWMNDPNFLNESYEDNDNGTSRVGELEQNNNLEWKAYWSEEHKREYYHNVITNQTCWTRPKGVQVDFKAVIKANPQADIQVEDKNVAFTDETPTDEERVAVKDFTKKVNIQTSYSTNADMIQEFRPQRGDASIQSRASSTKTSKVLLYRRRRARRQRRNRRIAFAVLCATLGSAVFMNRDKLFSSQDTPTVVVVSPSEIDIEEKIQLEVSRKLEEERKRKEALEAAEEERKRNEAAEAERLRVEEENRLLLEQEAQKAQKALALEEEISNEIAIQEEEMRRPWGCNIPLAYLISRKCWMVAKKKPIFDLKALTDAMME